MQKSTSTKTCLMMFSINFLQRVAFVLSDVVNVTPLWKVEKLSLHMFVNASTKA